MSFFKNKISWTEAESYFSPLEKNWNRFLVAFLMFCAATKPTSRNDYQKPMNSKDYYLHFKDNEIPKLPITEEPKLLNLIQNLKGSFESEIKKEEAQTILNYYQKYVSEDPKSKYDNVRCVLKCVCGAIIPIFILWFCYFSKCQKKVFFDVLLVSSALVIIMLISMSIYIFVYLKRTKNPINFIAKYINIKKLLNVMYTEYMEYKKMQENCIYEFNDYEQRKMFLELQKNPNFKKIRIIINEFEQYCYILISKNILVFDKTLHPVENNRKISKWPNYYTDFLLRDSELKMHNQIKLIKEPLAILFGINEEKLGGSHNETQKGFENNIKPLLLPKKIK